jgi:hypothetical protein
VPLQVLLEQEALRCSSERVVPSGGTGSAQDPMLSPTVGCAYPVLVPVPDLLGEERAAEAIPAGVGSPVRVRSLGPVLGGVVEFQVS